MDQLPYKNWRRSRSKWEFIVKAVKNKEPFNNKGFPNFPVVEKCAYCTHYLSCDSCPLAKISAASQFAVCYGTDFHLYSHVPRSIFWEFIYEMRKHRDKIDWEKALRLARIKLAAIKNNGRELGYI